MVVAEILEKSKLFLEKKGIPTSRLDSEILLAHVLNVDRMELYLKPEQPLEKPEMDKARELLVRRAGGEPIAYIVGIKGFYKNDFVVGPGVLIPRPETELLVEKTLELGSSVLNARVLDVGCGSGCIGLSVVKEKPNWSLEAIDIHESAIEIAKVNAERLEVQDRVCFQLSDFAKAELTGPYDFVLANPPYISVSDDRLEENVKRFEPEEALFSDNEGFFHLQTWSELALPLLKPKGWLMLECGQGQSEKLAKHLVDAFYVNVSTVKDLRGIERVVVAQKG